jgi:hypothetical protein
MVQSTKAILEERGTRYGVFMGQAQIAQSLHIVLEQGMKLTGKNRFTFAPDQLEAMNMIVNKIARIYNGDPNYSDSWRDIAGYATLVADRLDNDSQKLIEEKERNDRDRTTSDVETNRGSDEEPRVIPPANGYEPGSDNRPTGQPELRRLPVRLNVNDGIHSSTSETQPGVPGTPRQ